MPALGADRPRTIDRAALSLGVPAGPGLVLLGYLVALRSDGVVTDWRLLVLTAWPTVAALLVALLPGRRRWWLSFALGCGLGTVLTVALVLALIAGVAFMLSDPGGQP